MYDDYKQILVKSALFKGIKSIETERVIGFLKPRIRRYSKFEDVILQGDRINEIGIVLEGNFAVYKTTLTGKRKFIYELKPSELFGITDVFTSDRKATSNLESIGYSRIMFINVVKLFDASKENEILMKNILSVLANEVEYTRKKMEYLNIKGLKVKFATYIYSIYLETGRLKFNLPMKKYELAEFFNTARPSLSREIINLRNLGIIDFSGSKIKIQDIKRLKKIIDEK